MWHTAGTTSAADAATGQPSSLQPATTRRWPPGWRACTRRSETDFPEHLRETTLRWLREHGLPEGELVLRADGDRSPAVRLKVARLREIASAFSIGLLVDDDEQVTSAVRDHRPPLVEQIVVADWQDGGSRRTLHRAQERDGRT
jgi:hypothetical protein